MLTDSVQPYNKPIIDLACSVCTVKYQTSVFCMDVAPSSLGPYKNTSVWYFTVQTSRSVNKPFLQNHYIFLWLKEVPVHNYLTDMTRKWCHKWGKHFDCSLNFFACQDLISEWNHRYTTDLNYFNYFEQ